MLETAADSRGAKPVPPATTRRRGVVITNLLPNLVERTRGMFVWQETQRLQRRYDLMAIAPLPWVPSFLSQRSRYSYHKAPLRETIEGIEISHPRYLVIPRMMRSFYGLFMWLSLYRFCRGEWRDNPPTFILAHYAFPDGWAAMRLARRWKIPILIKVRGSDVNLFTSTFVRRYLTVSTLKKANQVVAVSQALKRKMIELGLPPESISVVNNGINMERFVPMDRDLCRAECGLPPDRFTFLFIGTLRTIKGVIKLLHAFKAIPVEMRRRAQLVMIGDGDLRDELEERIERYGMGGRVTLRPSVPHADIPRWIGACDCLVLPSVMEGYPNVLVEALACARPVIASRVGGIPEIVRDGKTGILIPAERTWPLTDAMISMISGFDFDPREAAAAARTWEDVADDMSALVEKMLPEGGVS